MMKDRPFEIESIAAIRAIATEGELRGFFSRGRFVRAECEAQRVRLSQALSTSRLRRGADERSALPAIATLETQINEFRVALDSTRV